MVILTVFYLVLVWLVFYKYKWVHLNWATGSVAALAGLFILGLFLALLNYLTPSGRIVVAGPVVEVTPNVTGEITAIPVKINVPVKKGTVLFQIDPAPFKYKTVQAEAALVQAKQQADTLKANYQQATANVEGASSELSFKKQRLTDIEKLVVEGADPQFKLQDLRDEVAALTAKFEVAKAAQQSAKLALKSQIGGVNTTVVQNQSELDNAKWELEQTTVRAPADGFVTAMALSVGDRALQFHSAISFIVADGIRIVGMFAPNGFQTIKPGAPVVLVFENNPGRLYYAKITDIPRGIGEGQIAVSGTLARDGAIGGATAFPAVISVPEDMDVGLLRLGMPGTATVFADNAGVVGLISRILIWINSYTAYL